MKIAIIGSGISGLTAGHLLSRDHEVTLYEAGDYLGGHTHTVDVDWAGRRYPVDTGFIVFNHRTYPNFTRLLDELGVESQPTEMSLSVRCEFSGLEYSGSNLNTLFAQRSNLLRPSFHRMLADILRFNREAPALLADDTGEITLGAYLRQHRYSRQFVDHYLVPMAAAIWSAPPGAMWRFPARYLVRFLHNHGLLSINDRPQWRVIRGGSRQYIEPLTRAYRERIHLATPVVAITRHPRHVMVWPRGRDPQRYDRVVLANHSNQALALLSDASPAEREILGAIHYQKNEAILHTDAGLLPRRRRAWASWNCHVGTGEHDRVALTYYMNRLQNLDAPVPLCVTLNHSAAVDPNRVLARMTYHHPLYTPDTVAAQRRHAEIDGVRLTHFCGAYWGHGFHEDGVNSALAVVANIQGGLSDAQPRLRRTG